MLKIGAWVGKEKYLLNQCRGISWLFLFKYINIFNLMDQFIFNLYYLNENKMILKIIIIAFLLLFCIFMIYYL